MQPLSRFAHSSSLAQPSSAYCSVGSYLRAGTAYWSLPLPLCSSRNGNFDSNTPGIAQPASPNYRKALIAIGVIGLFTMAQRSLSRLCPDTSWRLWRCGAWRSCRRLTARPRRRAPARARRQPREDPRMDRVRDARAGAWVAHGDGLAPAAGASLRRFPADAEEGSMQDLLFIALTIVAFGAMWLLLKGVERFDR